MKSINSNSTKDEAMNIKPVFTALNPLFSSLEKIGGQPYLVGGCVRDTLLQEKGMQGISFKDIDIEVHGLDMDQLMSVLEMYSGSIDIVGKSFGIIKVMLPEFHDVFPWMEALDVSLPRTESKAGSGHKGFDISVNPWLGLTNAAARRDFTLNSMAMDIEGIRDPYNGVVHLHAGVLSATSSQFGEDPLRVLRGMGQAGRFGLVVDAATADVCVSLKEEYVHLSKERIWGEWWKWATKSAKPSLGLEFLVDTGWIDFYPEIKALIGVPQDKHHHPEGSVWVHTGMVCDAAAEIAVREGLSSFDRGVLVMAALCHDLAKPGCTVIEEDGRITSKGHEKAGEEPTRSLFSRMGYITPKKGDGPVLEAVLPLVVNHLAHCSMGSEPSAKAVRKLSTRVSIEMLALMVEADHSGRHPLPPGMPEGMKKILSMSKDLGVSQGEPEKLITGKVLISAGVKPGKEMGEIVARAYEGQLDGAFSTVEEGLAWLDL